MTLVQFGQYSFCVLQTHTFPFLPYFLYHLFFFYPWLRRQPSSAPPVELLKGQVAPLDRLSRHILELKEKLRWHG
jgi:hypothetical protein